MDKEEFRIKLEEINHLVEKKDYKGALNVVDSIDWRRVKNVRTLCVVGEIYAANKRYEDSKEIFLLAYHRAPIGKNILYRLIEVSLKMGDVNEAMEFFEEYLEVAPNDNTQYVLKYKIYSAKGAPLSEQIKILEEYKEKEFTERWSYELGKLYYKAGEKEKCLDLCNEIVLWFNEGNYVMKALDLKMRMGALTGAEKEKYEQQFIPKLITPEEAKALQENGEEAGETAQDQTDSSSEEKAETRIESISVSDERDLNSMESLPEKISKGIRDIFGTKKKLDDEDDFNIDEDLNPEEVQEEMLKSPIQDEEIDDVPELEPEDPKPMPEVKVKAAALESKEESSSEERKRTDFSETIRMPELKIPKSMRNLAVNEVPEIPASGAAFEEAAAANADEFDFNLEDTILAAATAQGIEIPDDKKENVPKQETKITEEPVEEIPELEDEEFLSEEDLQEAEEEFLNGPKVKTEVPCQPQKKETEVPNLEPEAFLAKEIEAMAADGEEDIDEDEELIRRLLKEYKKKKQEEKASAAQKEEIQEMPQDVTEDPEVKQDEPEEEISPLTQEEELERFIDSIQPMDDSDPLNIVPRERTLREEEKSLFTYFVKVPGMKEQLVNALCDAQLAAADKTSRTGNIIIMGGRETGKTRLIASLIPAICNELNLEASKVAYVFADQINGKNISRIVSKLAGGFLVIENANQLSQETVEQLDKAMEFRTDGMTVILEDEKIGMRKMIARFPKFAKKFTSVINIPVFTNDELVNFARVYTKENGYVIDQMGMLALYNQIGMNQKEDEPMNIGAVKELIDTVIARSEGGIKMFKKKRMDRDGYKVLTEKDFSK